MKIIIGAAVLFVASSTTSFAQKDKEDLPTYDQIMPKFENMVDYGIPGKGQVMTVNASLLGKNIFDYPENSVIYYLDGKKTVDRDYVKKMIDLNAYRINHVATDEIGKDGKRIIRIDYKKKADRTE